MELTRIATFKPPNTIAIVVELDGGARSLAILYSALSGKTEEQINAIARTYLERDDFWCHWNRDGSIAIAMGQEPEMWPEDDTSEDIP